MVSIEASDAEADEVLQRPATFKISRGTDTEGDLAVKLVPGGGSSPAAGTADYQLFLPDGSQVSGDGLLSTYYVVTIPDGQKDILVTLKPKEDRFKEGDESLTLTISQLSNQSSTPYNISPADNATVTIKDGWGRVTFNVIIDEVEEDANVGIWSWGHGVKFAAKFWGAQTTGFYLPVSFTGDAEAQVDYVSPPTSIYMDPGSTSMIGIVTIKPIADLAMEDREAITIGLQSGFTLSDTTVVADPEAATATGYIADDDSGRELRIYSTTHPWLPPSDDVTNSSRNAEEGSVLYFKVERLNGSVKLQQEVVLNFMGNAVFGRDYTAHVPVPRDGFRILFGPGESVRTFEIAITDDASVEREVERVVISAMIPEQEGDSAATTIDILPSDLPFDESWVLVTAPSIPTTGYSDWVYKDRLLGTGGDWVRVKTAYYTTSTPSGFMWVGTSIEASATASWSVGWEASGSVTFAAGVFEVQGSGGSSGSVEVQKPLPSQPAEAGHAYYARAVFVDFVFIEQRIYDPEGDKHDHPLGLEPLDIHNEAGDDLVTSQNVLQARTLWGSTIEHSDVNFEIYKRRVAEG